MYRVEQSFIDFLNAQKNQPNQDGVVICENCNGIDYKETFSVIFNLFKQHSEGNQNLIKMIDNIQFVMNHVIQTTGNCNCSDIRVGVYIGINPELERVTNKVIDFIHRRLNHSIVFVKVREDMIAAFRRDMKDPFRYENNVPFLNFDIVV